ncbi:MAG: class I SAM-dependent methyltransferase [Candidatus Schekmanbacteria bacterium]|nr:class I SAM-dependent methyltransferase [Candidatus Schekmanbacteria bacterium]
MTSQTLTDHFLSLAVQEIGFKTPALAQGYIDRFLDGVDLADKNILDIGCGTGLMSIYSACRGAAQVIGLEPEEAGSSSSSAAVFNKMAAALKLANIVCYPQTLQEFAPNGLSFDLILSHSSINHLDEKACVGLRTSRAAREKYLSIFTKLSGITKNGGKIVILDCSPYNFFDTLGMKNPLSSTIEWHKHQTPDLWIELLKQCGYTNPRVDWLVPAKLKSFEKILANRYGAFFTRSAFKLVMEKKSG